MTATNSIEQGGEDVIEPIEDVYYSEEPATREEAIKEGWFVCYECKDGYCGRCIGIPCRCPCPIPETEPEYSI